ncbi:MAG: COX15/CtaA family protein [Chlorobi bacterium]|nr:COX15/CtaA family protein [Chlorobiota bacterium]
MKVAFNQSLRRWLTGFALLVGLMVIVGGFVRLTRSGLSIVEWNPISGAIPPLTEQAWQEEFAKYQRTPEYQKVNREMTLEEYRYIFWIEWIHRQLARAIGLYFALPFLWFWIRGQIPREHRGQLIAIGVLFLAQAVMGWLMVASGLIDQPAVSHFRLTAHLLLALTLIGVTVWTINDISAPVLCPKRWNGAATAACIALGVLTLQIMYGGMTAGLKAGYLSDTWPLMFGTLVPAGLLSFVEPAWLNFLEAPVTVMFVHRWLPFIGLVLLPLLWSTVRRQCGYSPQVTRLLWTLLVVVVVQITLGIAVVLMHVALPIALVHQAGAIALLVVMVRLLYLTVTAPPLRSVSRGVRPVR